MKSSIGQYIYSKTWGCMYTSLMAQKVKNPPSVQGTWVQFLGREDLVEKGMATHCSILAWRIPWTEEPSGLQSVGSQRVRPDWATFTVRLYFFYFLKLCMCVHICMYICKVSLHTWYKDTKADTIKTYLSPFIQLPSSPLWRTTCTQFHGNSSNNKIYAFANIHI